MKIKRYGWWPDIPDHRDHKFAAKPYLLAALPPKVDMRAACPPVYDQSDLGSCTGNAGAGAYQFEQMKQDVANFVPSRLAIYYWEREEEGTVSEDSGATIRTCLKVLASYGAPPETMWPYDVNKFADKPPQAVEDEGQKHQVLRYMRLNSSDITALKGCLAEGYPFIFGFAVYSGFESSTVALTGNADLPGPGEQQLGGHAVMCVGYDDAEQRFIVRNSWGDGWGQHGYFTLPYEYLTRNDLSDDFWTIRLVE